MINPYLSTKACAQKYGLKLNTLSAAIRRGDVPAISVDGKVYLVDDTTPEFHIYLAECQKRVASRHTSKEATTKKQAYSRWYYENKVKPRRQAKREAMQTRA